MEIKCSKQPAAKVGFKGYQHQKSDAGQPLYNFNFIYDSKHWDCSVEFFKVKRNDYDYSYSIDKKNGKLEPYFTKKMSPNGTVVNIEKELKLKNSEPVAYRYKLTNKNDTNWVKYAKDDDKSICGDGFNLITRKGTNVTLQGPMYLGIPDSLNPGYVFAGFHADNTGEIIKDENAKDYSTFSRTFSNKAGGTLAGVIKLIPEFKKRGITRFIGTPATGGDNRSSHMYWIKRMNQTSPTLGNIDNYDYMHKELFKNGIGFVADSAYTSAGLEAPSFQYAIRWMNNNDKPHEYYMFRMQGLQDAALGFGVVPENMDNLRHKVVNSPDEYKEMPDGQIKIIKNGNQNYDPKQPTYIQVFDDSMVSDDQRNDKQHLIEAYDKGNPTVIDKNGEEVINHLAINTHDDTLVDNAFKIDPAEYRSNIKYINAINKNRNASDKLKLNSPMGTLVVGKFSGFEIRPKDEGGFVTWNAKTDIAKVCYTESDYDTQMLENIKNPRERAIEETKIKRAHAGNRDMLTETMRYWTRHVRNVQNEYTAKTLGKLGGSPDEIQDRINSLIYNRNDQKLPDGAALKPAETENLFYNDYKLRPRDVSFDKALDKALMALPLTSIELADDTVGVLGTPYLTKHSPDLEHIGESRYDAMHDETFVVPKEYANVYKKMDKVFTTQIHDFAVKVLHDVDKNSDEKIFQNDGSKLTEYGQYVVPLVAGNIAKYAIIKSLVPTADTKILEDGTLSYDYDKLQREATLDSIGINGDSREDEANQVVNKIKHGTENLDFGDVTFVSRSIRERIKDTNALSFRFAEAMVDNSGLGLDHRIDAAKDVADMDAVRDLDDKSDDQFAEVINIWEPAVQAVKEENPHALMIAEFTDLYDTMKYTYGTHDAVKAQNSPTSSARFKNADNILNILLAESGMNSDANYTDFFTAGLNTFGKDFVKENGFDSDNKNTTEDDRVQLLETALTNFADKSMDYKRNVYTFGGNHDKPRMVDCFGMDMALAHCNLNNRSTEAEIDKRRTAYKIMNDITFDHELNEPNPEYFNKKGEDIIKSDDDYFNNVSSLAIAKADWLRSSIGLANRIITDERVSKAKNEDEKKAIEEKSNKIYAAYSQAVKDVVNGNYYLNGDNDNNNKRVPDSYKKQLEKDGFGAKDINTAYGILTQQAKAKYGLCDEDFDGGRKQFDNLVEKIALGIPSAKVRMFTQMINAIPGNPTVYAGDEFAMSGYEEKSYNVHLEDRNIIPWETANSKSPNYKKHIADHKAAMDGIVKTRSNDLDAKLKPLNGGAMYKLNPLYGDSADKDQPGNGLKCPALLAQSSDGSMVVTIFNFNGISLENPLKDKNLDLSKIDKLLNPHPTALTIKNCNLQTSKTNTNFDIPTGLKFKNVDDTDKSYYETRRDDNGNCYLKRVFDGGREDDIYIGPETAPEGVLRLYYQPEDVQKAIAEKKELENKYTVPSFKGLKKRVYYNPQYNISVSNPYSASKQAETGSNLSLVSASK